MNTDIFDASIYNRVTIERVSMGWWLLRLTVNILATSRSNGQFLSNIIRRNNWRLTYFSKKKRLKFVIFRPNSLKMTKRLLSLGQPHWDLRLMNEEAKDLLSNSDSNTQKRTDKAWIINSKAKMADYCLRFPPSFKPAHN